MNDWALYPAAVADAAYVPLLIYLGGNPPNWWDGIRTLMTWAAEFFGRPSLLIV